MPSETAAGSVQVGPRVVHATTEWGATGARRQGFKPEYNGLSGKRIWAENALKVEGLNVERGGSAARLAAYCERLVAGLLEEDPRCAAITDGIARVRELAEAPAADSNGQRGHAGLQHVPDGENEVRGDGLEHQKEKRMDS